MLVSHFKSVNFDYSQSGSVKDDESQSRSVADDRSQYSPVNKSRSSEIWDRISKVDQSRVVDDKQKDSNAVRERLESTTYEESASFDKGSQSDKEESIVFPSNIESTDVIQVETHINNLVDANDNAIAPADETSTSDIDAEESGEELEINVLNNFPPPSKGNDPMDNNNNFPQTLGSDQVTDGKIDPSSNEVCTREPSKFCQWFQRRRNSFAAVSCTKRQGVMLAVIGLVTFTSSFAVCLFPPFFPRIVSTY